MIGQGIRDPKDFETLPPGAIDSIPSAELNLGMKNALAKLSRASYRPTAAPPIPQVTAASPAASQPVLSVNVSSLEDTKKAEELLQQLQASDVPNPATAEVFESLNLDDLSADIMPPAKAAKEAQKHINACSTNRAIFYEKEVSKEYAPLWASPVTEKGNVNFGSIFAYLAALMRFLLMTVTLNTKGRNMWDVPARPGSEEAREPKSHRRMGLMFNYLFTLLQVAHRVQTDRDGRGEQKVRLIGAYV